jgi:hypothetical protein
LTPSPSEQWLTAMPVMPPRRYIMHNTSVDIVPHIR